MTTTTRKITKILTGTALAALAVPAAMAATIASAPGAPAYPCYYYTTSEDAQYVTVLAHEGISNANGPGGLGTTGHLISNDLCGGSSPLAERDVLLAINSGLGVTGANWMVNEAARVYLHEDTASGHM